MAERGRSKPLAQPVCDSVGRRGLASHASALGEDVFLSLLSAEQQLAFARAAVFLVHADEELDEREEVLLDQIQNETGLPELPPSPDEKLVRDDLAVFDSPVSQRIFLLELAGIVTADGDRHEDELAPLIAWAEALGLDPAVIGKYLGFAERVHDLYDEARSLVLEGSQ